MVKTKLHIIRIFTLLLLLLTGMGNEAWAAYKVIYHILTLPIDNSIYHMNGSENVLNGKRLEAVRVVDNNATKVNLPEAYKSPLAKNFKYYESTNVTKYDAVTMYNSTKNKSCYYTITAEDAGHNIENADVTDDIDVYVTYEYDDSKGIALDGSAEYNLTIGDGFLAFNRGRNNRVAVFRKSLGIVDEEALASEDFVQFAYTKDNKISGTNISTYWQSNDNKNTKESVAGQFHFRFKFEGSDPYNIIIGTAYNKDYTYIEKHGSESKLYYKWYKGSHLFQPNDKSGFFLASDDHKAYTKIGTAYDPNPNADLPYDESKTGYFKSKGSSELTYNTFALLNNSDKNGYVFMVSRFVDADGDLSTPGDYKSASYNFLVPDNNYNNLIYALKTLSVASQNYSTDEKIYQVKEYVFKVKTPLTGTVLSQVVTVSEYFLNDNPKDYVPDALKRKYVEFKGAYKETGLINEYASFAAVDATGDAETEDGKKVIWLKYETSMPFEALPVGGCYNDARYYTIRLNGSQEPKNLGYLSGSSFYTGLGDNSSDKLHQGENSAEAQFAFIGDPYELKIISRAASEAVTADGTPAASHNRYVGCATDALDGTTLTVKDGTSDISTWQIEPGNITNPDYFVLRQFNTEGKYIGWNSGAENKPMTYSTTSTTIRVVELEKKDYVYHIVRGDGSIAVKATEAQDIGTPLRKKDVPDIIHSPFIDFPAATVTFYSDAACSNAIKHAPYTFTDENKHIYVKYNMNGAAAPYLDNKVYHVMLNGEYIYYDNGIIKSKEVISDDEAASGAFKWKLGGNDPYAMTIQTMDENVANYLHYVEVTNWATGTISNPWPNSVPDSKFIVKLSPYTTATTNVYEVMAATGDGTDASETYYNIGRLDNTTVKMVDNTSSAHGSLTLRFRLFPTESTTHNVTYHLIDKEGVDLLQTVARHTTSEAPDFPAQYRSPLVTNYHYYVSSNFTTNTVSGVTHYTLDGSPSELTTIGDVTDVYVLYNGTNDVSNQYDMQNKRITYLLKYKSGTPFRAEDGSDGLGTTPVTPIYPYCNGDCCFFVYGQDQFDLQQEGAASTRTRWAWYLESTNNDPYHVKICSRQQETYNQDDIRGYFATYQPDDYDKVVTTLVWPTISGIQGADYMILGTTGNFRLVTTNEIPLDSDHNGTPESTQRYTVKSFEQYWKTFDTVKKKILDGELDILEDKDKGNSKYEDPDGSILVPTSPASYRESLTDEYNFHSYKKWAYAKRFNGYNKEGKTSKGWEEIEHWFQTVDMGEGYFSLEEVDINPVMILLDQHGWEIMRKPLPTSPTDPTKAAKYNQIRLYDSPMVEKYYFWTKASKRSGFHQYYNLSQQVMVDGEPYTSTTLTELPPYDTATNLRDAKGNQYDEYVTYTVKDEYVQSYNSSTKEGAEFLIQQGSKYASYNGTDLSTPAVTSPGGMQQYIVDNINNLNAEGSKNSDLWYVKPNARIDYEMGYVDKDEENDIETNHDWTDEENYTGYTGAFSDGFDPYNIQISSVPHNTKYFVTNATGATLAEGAGSLIGTYVSDPAVSIREPYTNKPCTWYDSRELAITNATFMAVQDADGNMQLMPRFDHTTRMKDFSALVPTTDPGIANTYTELYRPQVYNYHILDNEGNESLRYRSGGDLVPQTPDHFKSPLAKDFKYYKESACENEVEESFAGESMTATTNDVYVRYSYDEEADVHGILQGKWLTMKLNNLDAHYTTVSATTGIFADASPATKPATIDGEAKEWQWKFLKTPQSDPDPYAVQLFNRNNPGSNNELPTSGKYFALLSHTSDGFALAEARTENANYDTYNFLNGNGAMSSSSPAAIAQESGFLSTSCSFSGTNSQLNLFDEVEHTYNYKIYTNSGAFAISATQDNETIVNNEYVPVLPENIKSPLLNWDQFRYYNKEDVTFADGGLQIVDAEYPTDKPLSNLYGLYDDEVVVHYTAYDPLVTEYKVPNERVWPKADAGDVVERASSSNDASIEINNELLYNIIWHSDNMMVGSGDAITDGGSLEISGTGGNVWTLAGDDPYAIKIRQNGAEKYVYSSDGTTCNLSGTATTFMLLPRDDNYEYGMFQVTGGTQKLTGFGSTLTTGDAVPTKFIIFALSTHKVTYHLVIANIGNTVNVYYPDKDHTIEIEGTTQRDLTANAIADHAVGHVSLGDPLKVPEEMYRPNVDFFFYVGDIKDVNNDGTDGALNESLTNLYKGHLITAMGKDPNLVGKHVYINIVYSFQGGLPTNAGDGFVLSVDQNKWYTFEAQKRDGTPQLMQFTNAWGMEVKEGRGTHYTNDYLWTPIGDPYGFKMYHRYTCVNSGNDNKGEPNRVMTTAGFSDNEEVWMDDASGTGANKISSQGSTDEEKEAAKAAAVTNSVYELLADKATESSPGTTQGYFKIHPVANSDGTQYYFKIVRAHENPLDDSTPEHDYVRLSSDDDYTEFTFGLSEDLVRPYYDRHGYVGGLKDDEYNTENADKKAIVDALKAGKSLTSAQLMTAQSVVYNPANIVKYSPGYYRLHSPEDIEGVTVRYASGYTHKKELTGGENDTPIPMHFYERKGVNTTFEILGSGFTRSDATRGAIPISEPVYDPASIFYFYEGSEDNPMTKIQTQGLYLKGVKGAVDIDTSTNPATLTNPSDPNIEDTNERAAAVMTATSGEAQQLYIMDIGGGILLIHDNVTALGRQYLKYLSFDQNDPDHIYDLKLTHNTHTDYAKWLMEPANAQGLTLAAHSGFNASVYGATYYHTTFCAPFDVLISGDKGKAYTCVAADSPWPIVPPATKGDLHPKPIGEYNTGTYASNNNFVPAGTPVMIATTDNSGTVKLTIPTTSPSTPISTIFSGKYLEQKLDGTNIVYTFGLPFTSSLTMDNETGDITGTLPQQAETGVGFYINANPNKELGLARAEWIRNNRYVIHNKIYYRSESSGASAPEMPEFQFVPVIFDEDGELPEDEELQPDGSWMSEGDGCIYDLLGRKVATKEQVTDGSWRERLSPGIYILNGKKFKM